MLECPLCHDPIVVSPSDRVFMQWRMDDHGVSQSVAALWWHFCNSTCPVALRSAWPSGVPLQCPVCQRTYRNVVGNETVEQQLAKHWIALRDLPPTEHCALGWLLDR